MRVKDYADCKDGVPRDTVILNMPFEAYSAFSPTTAVRASELREAAKSAAHWAHVVKHPKHQTPEMLLGTWAHMAVLEPERFASFDASTLTRKPERESFLAAKEIQRAVSEHPLANELIHTNFVYREASIFWNDRFCGMLCKARLDVLAPAMSVNSMEMGYVLDLKTTRDCTPYAFRSEVLRQHYALQLAHYSEAALACGAITHEDAPILVVACEKSPPYAMIAWDLSAWLDFGRRWRKQSLATIAEAMQSGKTPGYAEHMQVLEVPDWAPQVSDIEFRSAPM